MIDDRAERTVVRHFLRAGVVWITASQRDWRSHVMRSTDDMWRCLTETLEPLLRGAGSTTTDFPVSLPILQTAHNFHCFLNQYVYGSSKDIHYATVKYLMNDGPGSEWADVRNYRGLIATNATVNTVTGGLGLRDCFASNPQLKRYILLLRAVHCHTVGEANRRRDAVVSSDSPPPLTLRAYFIVLALGHYARIFCLDGISSNVKSIVELSGRRLSVSSLFRRRTIEKWYRRHVAADSVATWTRHRNRRKLRVVPDMRAGVGHVVNAIFEAKRQFL